ncbi:lytic transglycosylase domain-containing protein [Sinorhizobium mexicanum]|uniref:Lytic transglycosylase domain-containing protein n=1 Tax=Sinorhizobium mexicanum TaxID=375549 RepID=A0A859QIL5_9HYPH|nr:lytic transglycosylase domain-containing protein [Sinorhizobium mexicanum]MBP1884762.1 type IV secretion system protein VirB1 [Sinorhizobium mexicanum]QLL65642.1 lytic transglycosylase domain-containing protein [Sinorhizobium mexicanum]
MPVAFIDLAQTCAPNVAPETIAAVISLESNFQPYGIRINSGPPLAEQPRTKADAIEVATALRTQRQDIQLGLGGIGVEELNRLNLTVSDAFDPCLNLKATASLLDGYYRLAVQAGETPTRAERVMLQSFYGRGDPSVGEMIRYDEQVQREAKRLFEKLASLTIGKGTPEPENDATPSAATASAASADGSAIEQAPGVQRWDVFTSGRTSSVLVFQDNQVEQSE